MSHPKHIGIVAVSPEGSALAYRELFRVASRLVGDGQPHPRVTLHNEPFALYLAALQREDWHAIGELLITSARKLAAVGAECVMTPDNVMQHGVHFAESASPIPWLKMTDFVADAVSADGRSAVGIIGTKLVMYGSTYQTMLGLRGVKVIAPEEKDAQMFDDIIFRELVHGTVKAASRQKWIDAIKRLADRGAQGVILGATEAPLLIAPDQCPLPLYDSTALLAEGAVRHSLGLAAKSVR